MYNFHSFIHNPRRFSILNHEHIEWSACDLFYCSTFYNLPFTLCALPAILYTLCSTIYPSSTSCSLRSTPYSLRTTCCTCYPLRSMLYDLPSIFLIFYFLTKTSEQHKERLLAVVSFFRLFPTRLVSIWDFFKEWLLLTLNTNGMVIVWPQNYNNTQ